MLRNDTQVGKHLVYRYTHYAYLNPNNEHYAIREYQRNHLVPYKSLNISLVLIKDMGKPLVKFNPSETEEKMIDELKPIFKTTTRAKVVRGCLKKAYEILKDISTNK